MIERVGASSCLPAVVTALDRLLSKNYSTDTTPFDSTYSDPVWALTTAGRYLTTAWGGPGRPTAYQCRTLDPPGCARFAAPG